ncbi:hypothetical protein T439DRAFT_327429 [Meredithblackwellia eburnea MCA 4105]
MGEAAKNTLSIVPKTTRYSPFKFNSLISGVGVPVLVDLVHVDKVQGSDEFSAFNRIAGVTDLGGLMRGYKLEIKHENPGIVIYKDGRAFGRVAKEQPKDLIEILLSSKFFKSAFYFVPLSDSDSDEENTFQEDPKGSLPSALLLFPSDLSTSRGKSQNRKQTAPNQTPNNSKMILKTTASSNVKPASPKPVSTLSSPRSLLSNLNRPSLPSRILVSLSHLLSLKLARNSQNSSLTMRWRMIG